MECSGRNLWILSVEFTILTINIHDKIPEKVKTENSVSSVNIEGIDTVAGLRRAAGKEEVYLKLLKTFVDNNGNFRAKSQLLQTQNRLDETGMLLHTLAGVAGNIGITEVYKLAQQLTLEFKTHIKGGSLNFTPILQNKLELALETLRDFHDGADFYMLNNEARGRVKDALVEIEKIK